MTEEYPEVREVTLWLINHQGESHPEIWVGKVKAALSLVYSHIYHGPLSKAIYP